tara:strand:- start:214 stop:714 length:501 start_codon:yes stop_codon:yes gene_type:complete
MTQLLFISRTDLVKNSIIDGNTDTDLFINQIKVAQEIHIESYLGSKLYDKISADIIAGTLTGDYLTLVNRYIQPMLIHFATMEYLPYAAYSIKSGGIYKHTSENAETVNKEEVDYLVGKEKERAEHYTRRFIDYMCDNSTKFPEYTSNTGSDIDPLKTSNNTTWLL